MSANSRDRKLAIRLIGGAQICGRVELLIGRLQQVLPF